jgi:beta-N-acetylhexosaminidase
VLTALVVLLAACSGPKGADSSTGAEPQAGSTGRTPASPGSPDTGGSDGSGSGSDGAGSSHGTAQGRYGVATGWGPTRAEIDRARRLVGRLSLPDLAGQVIVARYQGTGAPLRMVRRLHLGGVIVFDDNVSTASGLRHSLDQLQRGARHAGRRWPVLVGVDQEGGIVERLEGPVTRYPAFMTAGAARDPALTRAAYAGMGRELAGLGINLDFAPDADVTSGPGDPTIGSRSAGSFPRLVAHQATAAAKGFTDAGVIPVVKHFPGHGSVPANSHLELPVQHKSLRELRRTDLVPFAAAVEAGAPAVMVGHLDVRAVDPRVPSSLSRPVITGLLRRDLGFDGLVLTDALNMRAITDRYGSARASVAALRAGADVLLMPPSPRTARRAVVRAVRHGRLDRGRLTQAAVRQVALLLHQRADGDQGARPGSARAESRRLSAAGVTVVAGACSGRLVGPSVRARGSDSAARAFRVAARGAGLRLGGPGATTVAFTGYADPARTADVVVATDTPYVLADSDAPVKIALYGDTPGAMHALVRVLLGKAPAPGKLPVRVPGVERRGCPGPA